MLYDIEKLFENEEKKKNSEQYKKLVYDLESYIIDCCFEGEGEDEIFDDFESAKSALSEIKACERAFSLIRPILCELDMRESNKGFRMTEMLIYECVKTALAKEPYYISELFPIVAKRFSTSAHNCERLCRYACGFAKPTLSFAGKYPSLEVLTHRTYEKVTVKELCDALVRYLLEDCDFKIT